MSAPVDIEEVMENLKKIPMSQERFDDLKAKILQSRAFNAPDESESVRNLQNMTMKCVQDIKERLALITERRKQRNMEDKQKNSDFAAALAERNEVKENETTTKRGQKIHRTRIEVWRDEVKQHSSVEEKTISGIEPQQQQSTRRSTTKRPHDVASSSLEQPATATPANKRIKTVMRNDSSSALAPPTSSRKSIPWLSTRASMADEDVFADNDRPVPNQELRFDDKKNANDDHDEHDEYDDHNDHDDADEDYDEDEDADSEGSYESYLTELEQMLTREMAMVTVMALMLPAMVRKSEGFRQGLEEGGLL